MVSWNVNGLRACVRKGFMDYFHETDADKFCVQEIKLQVGQIELEMDGYYQYWNYAKRKGYSGTAVFTKEKPLSVHYGVGDSTQQDEGRILTLEYKKFYLVNVYTPNAQRDLARLDVRLDWEDAFLEHLQQLDAKKPVILCGDLNVAHQTIDLKNHKTNHGNSGFTTEERGKMTNLLDSGFVDTLRYFHPDTEGLYTWWSYRKTVRDRNIGWRIDYFLVSKRLIEYVKKSSTAPHIYGSDHCPIILEIDLLENS